MKKIDTLAKQLAEVAAERKELQVKEQALKDALMEVMRLEKVEKWAGEYGTATIARRSYYSYSDDVTLMEEEVKLKKIAEVEQGIAEEEVTEYILFKEPKTNEHA